MYRNWLIGFKLKSDNYSYKQIKTPQNTKLESPGKPETVSKNRTVNSLWCAKKSKEKSL